MATKNIERLNEIADKLPEICQDYLYMTSSEKAISSRIEYGKDLFAFLSYLISFHPDFCDLKVKDITASHLKKLAPPDISRYITIYKDSGRSERSTARKRASLSSFFTYLCNNRILDFNPVSGSTSVKIHTSEEVIHLTIEEQNRLLDCILMGTGFTGKALTCQQKNRARDFALVTLLLDTGMRVSEVQSSNVDDVNTESCYIIVTRKGGNTAILYFSDAAASYLDTYLLERQAYGIEPGDPLFTSRGKNRMTVRAIEYMVERYATAALPGKGARISPHKLRSTFAMDLYSINNDVLLVQRRLGHKSLAATNIYVKATEDQIKTTRNDLAAHRAAFGDKN